MLTSHRECWELTGPLQAQQALLTTGLPFQPPFPHFYTQLAASPSTRKLLLPLPPPWASVERPFRVGAKCWAGTCTGDPVEAAISEIRFFTPADERKEVRGGGSDLPFLDAKCGVLSRNDPCRLTLSNTHFEFGGTVWKELGSVVCWRGCVRGWSLRFRKTSHGSR